VAEILDDATGLTVAAHGPALVGVGPRTAQEGCPWKSRREFTFCMLVTLNAKNCDVRQESLDKAISVDGTAADLFVVKTVTWLGAKKV
jgi:hypothetical protein